MKIFSRLLDMGISIKYTIFLWYKEYALLLFSQLFFSFDLAILITKKCDENNSLKKKLLTFKCYFHMAFVDWVFRGGDVLLMTPVISALVAEGKTKEGQQAIPTYITFR